MTQAKGPPEEDLAPVTFGSTVTILFSDIRGFTEYTEAYGDEAAYRMLQHHNELVTEQIALCHGHIVKTLGDSFMVSFSSARIAIICAVATERAIDHYNRTQQGPRIDIGIGINTGEPVQEASDFFGGAVNLASRICAAAGPGRILISETVRHVVGRIQGSEFLDRGFFEIKGFQQPQHLFEVDWSGSDAVRALPIATPTETARPRAIAPLQQAPAGERSRSRPAWRRTSLAIVAFVVLAAVGTAVGVVASRGSQNSAVPISGSQTPVPGASERADLPGLGPTSAPIPPPTFTLAPTPRPTPRPASIPGATPGAPATPVSTLAPFLGLGYKDDFSNPKSGWAQYVRPEEEAGYVGGEYRILVKRTDSSAVRTIGKRFSDFDAQVKARVQDPAIGTMYGMVFHYEDGDNYYSFRVIPDSRRYSFYTRANGKSERIVPWNRSEHINRGTTPNLLRVVARGSKFELYVNGHLLDTVVDGTFTTGRIGLIARNEDNPEGAEIYFDDLEVKDLK